MRFLFALTTLLYAFSSSYAREQTLFTSSVTYCNPPESILVQQLDLVYYNRNQSIFFDISAASVESNMNVSINLLLNVYGMTPVNVTLDLCSVLNGALCPLPTYNFTGSETLPLPESLGVSSRIPSIAFGVPDLEGFAQLKLVEVGTGDVKACVQATLSNGWSAHQVAVEWSVGAVTLVTVIIAVVLSLLKADSVIPFRLVELLFLYQAIASSALIDLNYPSIYRSFALNFAWAMGFFSSPSSSIQQSINNMRALTGGDMTNSSSESAVGFVNRKLSPYNFLLAANTPTFAEPALNVFATQDSEVQTVTEASSNVLQAGIPIYVNSINISSANSFMTVFICLLDLIAIALAAFAVIFLTIVLLRRFVSTHKTSRLLDIQRGFGAFTRAWSLRLGLIVFFPVLTFAFYQWTLKDSWLSILFSAIAFVAVMACVGYPSFVVLRTARISGASALYVLGESLLSHGPLYSLYREPRFYFFVPAVVLAPFLRAIFIAFAKESGLAQIVLLLVLEGAIVGGHIVLKPYQTRGGDVLSAYLAIVRLLCTGLAIAFLERLDVTAIPRVVIGCVIGVVYSIAVLVLVGNIILRVVMVVRELRGTNIMPARSLDTSPDSPSLEKAEASPSYSRPMNPTPERNVPLDPTVNEPYPPFTPPTATTDHFSRDSHSTNLGSLLPRRWSFTPLSSPVAESSANLTRPQSTAMSTSSIMSRDSKHEQR